MFITLSKLGKIGYNSPYFKVGGPLPGETISNQSIAFGGLTLANAGGAKAISSLGAEIEFVSVDSVVSGDGANWAVSNGRLIRNSGTPASSHGAVLRCTTALGQIDVTIAASGTVEESNLAVAYSVISDAQLVAVMAISTANLSGKQILLRAVSEYAWVWTQWSNRAFSPSLQVRSHSLSNRAQFRVGNKVLDSAKNLMFDCIKFYGPFVPGVDNPALSALSLTHTTDGLKFNRCEFFGNIREHIAAGTPEIYARSWREFFGGDGASALAGEGLSITNCQFHDMKRVNTFYLDGTGKFRFLGNHIHNFGSDASIFSGRPGVECLIAFNTASDVLIQPTIQHLVTSIDMANKKFTIAGEDFAPLNDNLSINIGTQTTTPPGGMNLPGVGGGNDYAAKVTAIGGGQTEITFTSGALTITSVGVNVYINKEPTHADGFQFIPGTSLEDTASTAQNIKLILNDLYIPALPNVTWPQVLFMEDVAMQPQMLASVDVDNNRMTVPGYLGAPGASVNMSLGIYSGVYPGGMSYGIVYPCTIVSSGHDPDTTVLQFGVDITSAGTNVYLYSSLFIGMAATKGESHYDGAVVALNRGWGGAFNGMTIAAPINCLLAGNSMIEADDAPNSPKIFLGDSWGWGGYDNTIIQNVASSVSADPKVLRTIIGGNYNLGKAGYAGSGLFVGTGGYQPDNLEEFQAAYTRTDLVGTWDKNAFTWDVPLINAVTLPAFTDKTGANLNEVTASAPVQINTILNSSGEASAYGAMVSVLAGSEFRITNDEAGSSVVTNWTSTPAIITSGKWLWLRKAAAGSALTAVTTRVQVGLAKATWTLTSKAVTTGLIASMSKDISAGEGNSFDLTGIGLQENDFVLLWGAHASNTTRLSGMVVTQSGWTTATDRFSNDTNDTSFRLFYKKMGAVPDTVVQLPLANGSDGRVIGLEVWRGIDPTTPFDVVPVATGGLNSRIPDPTAVTPVTAGAKIIVIAACAHKELTKPELTASYLAQSIKKQSAGSTYAISTFSGSIDWTSGAYDPAAMTISGDNVDDSWASVTFALRPAV